MLSNVIWTFLPPKRPSPIPYLNQKKKLVRSTQQFHVSLYQVLYNYKVKVPPIVVACYKYLDNESCLSTEKLFRLSVPHDRIKHLKELANSGAEVTFTTPHEAAALLKCFFRELDEPILGYNSYTAIIKFGNDTGKEDKFLLAKDILNIDKVPKENANTFRVFMTILNKVSQRSDQNGMTAEALGECTGPCLIWPNNRSMYIEELPAIAKFVAFAVGSAPSLLGRLPDDFDGPATPKIFPISIRESIKSTIDIHDIENETLITERPNTTPEDANFKTNNN